jgi:hypothetical protein
MPAMASVDRLDPVSFAGCFAYVDSEIPPGVTLLAWRSRRSGSERRPPQPRATTIGGAGAGADRAPQRRTPFGVRMRARRPRSGRGPSPRRYQ